MKTWKMFKACSCSVSEIPAPALAWARLNLAAKNSIENTEPEQAQNTEPEQGEILQLQNKKRTAKPAQNSNSL